MTPRTTHPENYLGDIKTWDVAEDVRSPPIIIPSSTQTKLLPPSLQQLTKALEKHYPGKRELNPGDGALYGPKIDITISDTLRRSPQCATIHLKFQLPERFNLKYRSAEGFGNPDKPASRPVIIHRAILGSLERSIATITEHFAGKW